MREVDIGGKEERSKRKRRKESSRRSKKQMKEGDGRTSWRRSRRKQ